ncbi:MAG TPA: sigma-70 family RNA polymerase sigma factor [Longimicrobiales bacterium]|nr:sigma-70 family RNA polymerase sigma factor [Longimicrobiales bacterium]
MDAEAAALRKPGFAEEALPELDAVYRFALRLAAGDGDLAQDLVQETFLRAYRAWESYTPGTRARSWLFTICRNVFLRGRERQARSPETPIGRIDADVESLAAVQIFDELREVDPERAFYDSFVDAEVLAAVDGLPEEFRDAVTLGDLHGLPYAEIAEILEVPVGTVKSRLFRGRRLLAKTLYDYAVDMGYIPARKVSP